MSAVVDPLEAVIALARADSALSTAVGARIDNRHHYGQSGSDWTLDAKSLVLNALSGVPQLYVNVQKPQIEARIYGDTFYDAGRVYNKLVDFMRVNERRTVAVTGGTSNRPNSAPLDWSVSSIALNMNSTAGLPALE